MAIKAHIQPKFLIKIFLCIFMEKLNCPIQYTVSKTIRRYDFLHIVEPKKKMKVKIVLISKNEKNAHNGKTVD